MTDKQIDQLMNKHFHEYLKKGCRAPICTQKAIRAAIIETVHLMRNGISAEYNVERSSIDVPRPKITVRSVGGIKRDQE